MAKIAYKTNNFRPKSLKLIQQCNVIIEDYLSKGFTLTLRQLYYQLVTRNLIENSELSYKRLGGLVGSARMCGLIDWEAIEDRTRNLRNLTTWENPALAMDYVTNVYRLDPWETQPYRPEIWIEKSALESIVVQIAYAYQVPLLSCRGYSSLSEEWQAAQRMSDWLQNGQEPIILYLGDHDPSGMDMSRDHNDRLETFMGGVEIRRLALNYDQVQAYNPPPNPAKITDTRFDKYLAEYGYYCWELDALSPEVLTGIIENSIVELIDVKPWQEQKRLEKIGKNKLKAVLDNWHDVIEWLGEEDDHDN